MRSTYNKMTQNGRTIEYEWKFQGEEIRPKLCLDMLLVPPVS